MTDIWFGDRSQQFVDEQGSTPEESKQVRREALQIVEIEGEHPCPECGEEMTAEEMMRHRLEDHALSVVDQLDDLPETLRDMDSKTGEAGSE